LAKPNLRLVEPLAHASSVRERSSLLEDRKALIVALKLRDPSAAEAFFREFEPLVERTISRILGHDDELGDATQEAFLRAIRSLERLRDPQALVDWLIQIAVCTATDFLRRKRRRRWLLFVGAAPTEGPVALERDESGREALRATYRVLDRMNPEERTVFALRFIEGMGIDALANAHDCSRSTVKRRLIRATTRFRTLARKESALVPWLDAKSGDADSEEEET